MRIADVPPPVTTTASAIDTRPASTRVFAATDRKALNALGTNDRYQFSAELSKPIGCGWIAEWKRAMRAGDQKAVKEAQDAMRGSRDWAMLKAMVDQGDWAESFWGIADTLAAGRLPDGYELSLECR